MSRQATLLSVLGVILVIALWWVFLYSPGQEDLQRLEDDIAVAEDERVELQTRINQLEQIRSSAPETEALIAQLGSIVPTDPALAGALRQIEAAAEDAGVEVQQLSTSRPALVSEEDADTGLHEISVSMSLQGSYFQFVDFLRRLEDPSITSRGLVFTSLSLSAAEYPSLTASISGTMFAVLDPVPEVDPDEADPAQDEATADDGDGGGGGGGGEDAQGGGSDELLPEDDEGGVE